MGKRRSERRVKMGIKRRWRHVKVIFHLKGKFNTIICTICQNNPPAKWYHKPRVLSGHSLCACVCVCVLERVDCPACISAIELAFVTPHKTLSAFPGLSPPPYTFLWDATSREKAFGLLSAPCWPRSYD